MSVPGPPEMVGIDTGRDIRSYVVAGYLIKRAVEKGYAVLVCPGGVRTVEGNRVPLNGVRSPIANLNSGSPVAEVRAGRTFSNEVE